MEHADGTSLHSPISPSSNPASHGPTMNAHGLYTSAPPLRHRMVPPSSKPTLKTNFGGIQMKAHPAGKAGLATAQLPTLREARTRKHEPTPALEDFRTDSHRSAPPVGGRIAPGSSHGGSHGQTDINIGPPLPVPEPQGLSDRRDNATITIVRPPVAGGGGGGGPPPKTPKTPAPGDGSGKGRSRLYALLLALLILAGVYYLGEAFLSSSMGIAALAKLQAGASAAFNYRDAGLASLLEGKDVVCFTNGDSVFPQCVTELSSEGQAAINADISNAISSISSAEVTEHSVMGYFRDSALATNLRDFRPDDPNNVVYSFLLSQASRFLQQHPMVRGFNDELHRALNEGQIDLTKLDEMGQQLRNVPHATPLHAAIADVRRRVELHGHETRALDQRRADLAKTYLSAIDPANLTPDRAFAVLDHAQSLEADLAQVSAAYQTQTTELEAAKQALVTNVLAALGAVEADVQQRWSWTDYVWRSATDKNARMVWEAVKAARRAVTRLGQERQELGAYARATEGAFRTLEEANSQRGQSWGFWSLVGWGKWVKKSVWG